VMMEGDPFALVEAMTIAGYATGSEQGFLYVRGEYALAAERLDGAIAKARAHGLLGGDVMGRGFRFDIELRRGAGAYICGEETALFASIEGFRGEPRSKPPFPVDAGLFGKPSVITGWGGQLDYLSPSYPFLVRYQLEEVIADLPDLPNPFPLAWARADRAHASERMRWVYEHREQARQVGADLAADLARRFAPKLVCARLAGLLGFEVAAT